MPRFVEDCRLDEIALLQMPGALTASEQTSAAGEPLIDVAQDLVVLALTHQGAKQHPGLQAGADGDFSGFLHQPLD